MSPITLSEDQQLVGAQIRAWVSAAVAGEASRQLTLGGLAGTGKTTLIKWLVQTIPHRAAVLTPTGKAAHVLHKKGISQACTIHSYIYEWFRLEGEWHKNRLTSRELEPRPAYIIVDETSMVSTELYDDLVSFEIPLLFVGDHGQLEPVGDDPQLMVAPDLRLEKVHRQALLSPIIPFAHKLRAGVCPALYDTEGRYAPFDIQGGEELVIGTDVDAWVHHAHRVDQIICGFNKQRHAINAAFREHLGHTKLVEDGDRVICLQNDQEHELFNGMQGTVRSVRSKPLRRCRELHMDILLDDGTVRRDIPVFTAQFGNNKLDQCPRWLTQWDYGYAITAHKAQGSEWDSVLVVEPPENNFWDVRRWSYTAATRASKQLFYFSNRTTTMEGFTA